MHDFIHEHCFLVPYSVWKHHPFQFSEDSTDGVSIGLSKIDLAARF